MILGGGRSPSHGIGIPARILAACCSSVIASFRLYAFLEQEGQARKSEFLELIDPDDVGYSSAESFWANCVKGRDSLRSLPGVEAPDEGNHVWRFSD